MLIFMFILLKCNVAYVVFPLKIVCIKLTTRYIILLHFCMVIKSVVWKPIPFSALSLSQHESRLVGWLVGWLVLSGTFEMD